MMQQNYVLSSKIKIAFDQDKAASKHSGFYANYSRFVLKALGKGSFQEFLRYMLVSENIEETVVSSVDIKVFPAPRKNGFNIVGRCNTFRGRIRIYPKTFNFCHAFRKKFGKNYFSAFVSNRARATLIHELLHMKYVSDEETVQKLTDSYFSVYLQKQLDKNSNLASLHDLIFSRKHPPFANWRFNGGLLEPIKNGKGQLDVSFT
jgi:hypothetical protein